MTTEKIKGILSDPKGRNLTDSQKLRLCAIAMVYMSKIRTARKITDYANSKGVDADSMAYRFAIGTCKQLIKLEDARNYDQAIQIIEDRQARVGGSNDGKKAANPKYGPMWQEIIDADNRRNAKLEPDQMLIDELMPHNLQQHYRSWYAGLSPIGKAIINNIKAQGGKIDFNKPGSRVLGSKARRIYDAYPYKSGVKIRDFFHNICTYL